MILFSSVEVIFSFKGKGNNVVLQRFSQAFNKVDPDQAMEWIHGTGKKSGGSIGITKTTSALCRWTLPYNLRSHIAAQTCNCNCNCNCKYDKLYSTVGGKPLLGCFTRTFTVSAISNTRDYRSSTVSTVF